MAELAPDISDKEFRDEVRRAVIILMRAMIRKYHMAWLDFLPREENAHIRLLAENHGTVGGAIDVATITRTAGFAPVQQKEITGEASISRRKSDEHSK